MSKSKKTDKSEATEIVKATKVSKPSGLILVIVESPNKITKIEHILGDGYKVMASVGHIIDLDKSKMSIDFENNFKPTYTVMEGKYDVIQKLKKAYYDCSDLLIATDEDREGEMIAWSVAKELGIKGEPKRIVFNEITKKGLTDAVKKPGNINYHMVDAQKLRRILDRIIGYKLSPLLWKSMGGGKLSAGRVQSVVVKLIIEKENDIKNFFSEGSASFFKTSGEFTDKNKNVLKSQLYTTKKQEKLEDDPDKKNADKEDNSDNESDDESKGESSDDSSDEEDKKKVTKKVATKVVKQTLTKAKGEVARIPKEKDAKEVMKLIMKSKFEVNDVAERESIRQPPAPFTTSTLQQEASRKFGFGSKRTMMAAQHLYEGGHITYMRTDSVNLSEEALKLIGDFVLTKYGKDYHRKMNYTSKAKNTQEAHEAVRPTDPKVMGVSADPTHKISVDEIKLYTLIWKRSVASQMTPAKFKVVNIFIDISELDDYYFVTQVENNIFLGYLAVYNLANDKNEVEEDADEENKASTIDIPKKGTVLTPTNVTTTEDYKRPPVRYNEASLVSKLDPKNLNIGRPSTYAAIIDKIQSAGYVNKEDVDGEERDSVVMSWDGKPKSALKTDNKKLILGKEKNKFVPTAMGILVVNFLVKHFPDIMDYKFTAGMEENLDEVAEGKLVWTKVLEKFWKDFQPLVEKLDKTIKVKEIVNEHDRELGKHPKSGGRIMATIGVHGPYVKMFDKDGNSFVSAPIKKPLTLAKVTLDDAVELFRFPINLGRLKGKIVSLNRGEYGHYLVVGSTKVSLKLEDKDVDSYKLEDAIKAIETKSEGEFWKGSDSKNIYIVKEHVEHGKYILIKSLTAKKNMKPRFVGLPKDVEPSTLTIEKVQEIVANDGANKRKRKEDGLAKKGAKKDDGKKADKVDNKKESSKKKSNDADSDDEVDAKPKKVAKKAVAKEAPFFEKPKKEVVKKEPVKKEKKEKNDEPDEKPKKATKKKAV